MTFDLPNQSRWRRGSPLARAVPPKAAHEYHLLAIAAACQNLTDQEISKSSVLILTTLIASTAAPPAKHSSDGSTYDPTSSGRVSAWRRIFRPHRTVLLRRGQNVPRSLKIRLPSTIQSNSGSKIKIQRNQRRTNDR